MKYASFLIVQFLLTPCLAQDGVVLEGESVRAENVWIGAWVDIRYYDDRGELITANGQVKLVNEHRLTIGNGKALAHIEFEHIEVLVIGKRAKDVKRSMHSTKLNEDGRKRGGHRNTTFVAKQLLMGGLFEIGGGFLGAMVGNAIHRELGRDEYDDIPTGALMGLPIGVVVGSALGTMAAGAGKFKKPIWARALLGSLTGFGLGLIINAGSDSILPVLVAPPIFSTYFCWVGNERKDQYSSINLGLSPSGQQGVTFAWHF